MKMNTLFDMSTIPVKEPVKAEKGRRCRNCKHIYRHQYAKMQYCRLRQQKKTAYGNLKVKANAPACNLFEKADLENEA